MTRQYMVRIIRDTDDDYVDVVVDAKTKKQAKKLALDIVQANPDQWFGEPSKPRYRVDATSDVEDVTDGEYVSASL